jgi:hypothetical protein
LHCGAIFVFAGAKLNILLQTAKFFKGFYFPCFSVDAEDAVSQMFSALWPWQSWHEGQLPHEHPAALLPPRTARTILRIIMTSIIRNTMPIDIHCMMRFAVILWRL